jgi:hypothetical protein
MVRYDVAQAEIEQIKEKIRFVELAARKTLPTAIEIGEWFAKQRAKLGNAGWDDWEGWVASNFPNVSLRMVHLYVQLASEKQFLAARFTETVSSANPDFEALPTIKEAIAAIREKNRPIKRGAGRAPVQPRTIDVKATVTSGSNGEGHAQRATRVTPPVEVLSEAQRKGERIEHPDAPTNPKEEVSSKLGLCASCLRTASQFWREALVIADHHQIPVNDVQAELKEYFSEEPALVMCFTTAHLKA